MSYTRTITSNGNSISQEGGQSFNQQLDDLQEQIEEGGGGSITDLGTSSGTANALAGASLVDTATTFTAGRLYRIRTNAANSGAATCSINGGTGVAMKKSPSSAALASGDIADATELLLYYDGTNLQVLSGLTLTPTDIEDAGGATADQLTVVASLFSDALTDGLATKEDTITLLPTSKGGTGVDLSATGGTKKFLAQDASHVISARDLVDGDLPSTSNNATISAISAVADAAVPKSTVTAKGDIVVGTASGVVTHVSVTGNNGYALIEDSSQTSGVKFGAVTATDSTKLPLAGGTMTGDITTAPGFAIKSPGTSHAGDATYRNQYSLAAGSHYGFLFITDEIGSASVFTISGTTLTLYANFGANLWSADGGTDRKARISGGFIQVQCGTTFGAGFVSTLFLGTVR